MFTAKCGSSSRHVGVQRIAADPGDRARILEHHEVHDIAHAVGVDWRNDQVPRRQLHRRLRRRIRHDERDDAGGDRQAATPAVC